MKLINRNNKDKQNNKLNTKEFNKSTEVTKETVHIKPLKIDIYKDTNKIKKDKPTTAHNIGTFNFLKSSILSKINIKIPNKISIFTKKIIRHPDFKFFLVIVILGFTPILWYKTGFIGLGHDMGFPLDPISWFKDRIWSWNERTQLGQDQSVIMGSIVLHGFEAFLQLITGSVYSAQKISYIFWFMLPGISMYIFISRVLKSKNSRSVALIGAILFMYNLFFLQAWFIAERNKFAILSVLPLVLLFIIKVIRDKYSLWKAAIIISLLMILFNGGGSLPLFGSNIITISAAFICFSIAYVRSKKDFFRVCLFIFVTLFFFVLANAFWIVPQLFTLKNTFSIGVNNVGGIEGTKSWIQVISHNANYVDLLRMQGFPEWSDNHPYAPLFLYNPLLIIVSFAFIFLSIYAIKSARTRSIKVLCSFFLFVLIFNVILAAGSNGLLGNGYLWMIEHVPMFIVFRTPFYKFAGGIVVAYCFLFSFGLINLLADFSKLYQSFINKHASHKYFISPTTFQRIGRFLVVISLILYTFPFLTGSFFDWNKPVSTMVKVPDYVFQYGQYANDNYASKGKTMIVPDQGAGNGIDVYNWNFFSLDNVPSLISNKTTLNGFAKTDFVQNSNDITQLLYSSLLTGKNSNIVPDLLASLNIDNILLRKDVLPFKGVSLVDPLKWETALNANPYLSKEYSFGDQWIQYSVKNKESFYGSSNAIKVVNSSIDEIKDLSNIQDLNFTSNPSLFVEGKDSLNSNVPNIISKDPITHQDIYSVDRHISDISNGKIVYSISPSKNSYNIVTKSFDISQLWYNLYARKTDSGYAITVERPNAKITVNNQSLQIEKRSQEFFIPIKTSIDKIVINSKVFSLPTALPTDNTYIDQFQPNGTQLNISYGSSTNLTPSRNLLNDPSFEASLWGGSQICGGVLSGRNVEASRNSDHTDLKFSLNLSASNNSTACIIQEIKNLSQSKLYEMSFDYKNLSGYPLRYCILKRSVSGNQSLDEGCLASETLSKSQNWNTYTTTFVPSKSSQHILHYYSESEKNIQTSNLIDNIRFNELDLSSLGTYVLNTGIEQFQYFNLDSNLFENIGKVSTDGTQTALSIATDNNKINNLLTDGDFENGIWGGVNLCGGDPTVAKIKASQDSSDKVSGNYSARLEAQNGTACIYNSIQNFKPSFTYKITFNYKTISGNAPEFCALVTDSTSSECKPHVNLPASKDWTPYSTIIDTTSDTKDVILHFYSPAKNGESSVNLFDNVKIDAVYNPLEKIFLISDYNQKPQPDNSKIAIDKENPTSYKVTADNINSPEVVYIKNGYSPFWRMVPDNNQGFLSGLVSDLSDIKSILFTGKFNSTNNLDHFHVDGFANGWLVDKSGKYKIEYFPQKIFYLGLSITLIYISIIILILIFTKIKKSKKFHTNTK